MDRPLSGRGPLAGLDSKTLAELAQKLLAPSRECNSQGASFYRQTIYELANKTELERVIELSMRECAEERSAAETASRAPLPLAAPSLPAAAPQIAAAATAAHSPAAGAAAAPLAEEAIRQMRERSKKEYRPALEDRSLVEALLALHRAAPAPKPTAASAPVKPEAAREREGFSYAQIPEIEAAPKSDRYQSRAMGISRTILRPQGK